MSVFRVTFQVYKKHDPATSDEVECMENVFNSMCSALMLPANREKFLKGEGLQLMNLMLRSVLIQFTPNLSCF